MRCYELTKEGLVILQNQEVILNTDRSRWIITSPEELKDKKENLFLSDKAIEECQLPVGIPKIEVYDQHNLGALNILIKKDNAFKLKPVYFYSGKNQLVFIIKEELGVIKELEKEVQAGDEERYSLGKLLYILLDKMTATDTEMLHVLEKEIVHLEGLLVDAKKRDYIKEIIMFRKRLSFLKRHYEPLLDIASALEENNNHLYNESEVRYFKVINGKINRLNNYVLHLIAYVTQVREAYDAQVDINLNRIMKLFTLVTTIFLPLTLIVSWYGMNFEMPELEWKYGYLYAIALSVLSIIVCIYLFKRKKWF